MAEVKYDDKVRRITEIAYTVGTGRVSYFKVEVLVQAKKGPKGLDVWRGEINFADRSSAVRHINARKIVRSRTRKSPTNVGLTDNLDTHSIAA